MRCLLISYSIGGCTSFCLFFSRVYTQFTVTQLNKKGRRTPIIPTVVTHICYIKFREKPYVTVKITIFS